MTNIFVGNLKYEVTEDELRELFSQHGEVQSVAIIRDRATGQSKGFGFVEMPNKNEAATVIQTLNLQELHGRAMTVNEARPREERGPRAGGGGGYGGGGGGRGGRRDW
jgi:RNA recognition motif-containing protein